MKRVVVGMSGGIDSFVTALMLQQSGYEVIGGNLVLWKENDISDVQQVCYQLNIPLISQKGEELFREVVVEPFIRGYLSGSTPSPCCVCNSYIKWKLLDRLATEVQADYIATGHYVRLAQVGTKYYIRKGVDIHKDQSYFLWGVGQDILSKAITPLGEYTKTEVKAWALAHGYEKIVRKPESMGVCFLQGTDYREFVRQYAGIQQQPGGIFSRTGQLIGTHAGLLNYTVGQKRDMPVIGGLPMYVAEMDAERNIIVADTKDGLYTSTLVVKQGYFVTPEDQAAADITVKVRGLGLNPQGYARIESLSADRFEVNLSDPAWAVAPGQPVAFFRGDLVIGGGILER